LDYQYVAPAECPSEDALAAELENRRGGPVRIRIRHSSRGYHALVAFADGSTRIVMGATCEETFKAAVDATRGAPAAPPDKPAVVEREKEKVADEGSAPPVVTTPSETAVPRTPLPWTYTSTIGMHTTAFTQDAWMSGFGWAHHLERTRGIGRIGWLRPSFSFAWAGTFEREIVDLSHVGISARLLGLSLDACPVTFESGTRFFADARPCLRTVFGLLDVEATARGTSRGFSEQHAESGLWWSAGGVQRIRIGMRSQNGPSIFAELTGGVLFPLVRDRFHVVGAPTVVPDPIALTAGVGIGGTW
jgi:hypothetical protein